MLLRKVPAASSSPHPSPTPNEASEAGAEHRTSLKWKPSACLSHPSSTSSLSPVSQPRLVSLSGRGSCQLCLSLLSHPTSSLHTHRQRSPRGPRGSTIDRIHHPQVMGHRSPLFCFYLHSINHLFLVICMATLLHLAAGGSFLVSLPHLTSASWVILDSPATLPQTWPLKPACLCSRGSLSSQEPSFPISKPGSSPSTILQRVGRLLTVAGSLTFWWL